MTASVHFWFADILLNGVAALAVGFIGYLLWLSFRDRKERKARRERERERRSHWGYE